MKILKLLLVMLIAAAALCACGESDSVKLTALPEWQSFVIMRSDTAGGEIVQSAVGLKKAIAEKTGVELELGTDWVKRGEEPPVGTKEILIGPTNRPESAALPYRDYEVAFVNGRVVINGGSAGAVQKALEWFVENCVGDTISVPAERYSHTDEYTYAGAMVAGVPLKDYAVSNVEYQDEVKGLRHWMAEATGILPEVKGEHSIIISVNKNLGMNEISLSAEDGNIMLEVNQYGIPAARVVEEFKKAITESDGGEIQMLGKVELEMKQIETLTDAKLAEWRKMTDERIDAILTSPNMEIPAGKRVYYLSPNGDDTADGQTPETAWKTLEKLNSVTIPTGSYVCFERGGLWRGKLSAKSGVTYTAYGEGAKPMFYGSPLDGADASLWTKTDAENIWVFDRTWTADVGTIVFNHGEAHAIKCVIRTEADGSTFNNTTGEPFKTYADLTTDLHFYHDYSKTGKLYVYSETNPGDRFDSIEFNVKGNVVGIGGSNVTIDNLCIKYGGAHGVGAGTVKDLTVQNCEFGWIGGSIQSEGIFGRNYGTRYGNAVEIYGGCENFTVTDNYIYQVYDAGITQQIGLDSDPNNIKHQKNMTYARNVIEYCNYSIEYFLSGCVKENPSRMENFLIEDNYMWNAAEGFCEQRPDHDQGAHIKGWSGGNRNRATGYVVKNNLMIGSKDMLVQIMSDLYNPDGSDSMPTLAGNHFVGTLGGQFGVIAMEDQTRQMYGPGAVDYVGGKSDGTDTFWFN
ncbi:MAG: right-handed parallel beta-helix repeat-containing protein [Clostridia bacterium]|nr:right-handed parallel beta-helix repeat-containing protein [Clostridia bacterium]